MRWSPTAQDKICSASTEGHIVPMADLNTAHCHPRQKGECVACGQTTYSIAMDHENFSEFYTMPVGVEVQRGQSEKVRTAKQWAFSIAPSVRTMAEAKLVRA